MHRIGSVRVLSGQKRSQEKRHNLITQAGRSLIVDEQHLREGVLIL